MASKPHAYLIIGPDYGRATDARDSRLARLLTHDGLCLSSISIICFVASISLDTAVIDSAYPFFFPSTSSAYARNVDFLRTSTVFRYEDFFTETHNPGFAFGQKLDATEDGRNWIEGEMAGWRVIDTSKEEPT